ncbi:metallophosphoesterase [Ruminococcus sp.]|uniref:metallophosphoesterase n=1 Tax=Ruminococcus sp. TaxID=41978 RepID=UPI0025E4D3EC|nr:metallophosphoesterase [Ruminococcus sp.]MBQ8967555.1 metallophosphoesterase [Ruminococcus sp.]
MWMILFGGMFIAALLGVFYLITRFHRFGFMQRFSEKHRGLSWVLSALPVGAVFLFNIINVYASIVVLLHLMLIWAVCDLVAFIHRKRTHSGGSRYTAGGVALIVTAVYMGAGWFFAHHVFRTDYSFKTDKDLGTNKLRVAQFADSHLGITLDGEKFAEQMKRIQAEDPDVVVLVGDFVDDDSDKADMIRACQAMGELDVKYGVYYVDGNHDRGYGNYRNFTIDELYTELEKNSVTVLKDETVLIDNKFYLVGRNDKTDLERKPIADLCADLDPTKYTIVLDHQPNDYAAEAVASPDLVLSGHTHGGHIFPAGFLGLAMGANDRVYGTEVRGDTTFLVTSGISGWAIPFKTGCISEYVIIDIYDK